MRTYEEAHPWISFRVDLNRLPHGVWLLLGEAESRCRHLAGVPLKPQVAARLHEIYLSKGIHGTTSIEGNTLSEEEVLALIHGELELPKSREYLAKEVENVLDACNSIVADVQAGRPLELNPERIKHFNRMILDGLEVAEEVVPGQTRQHSVAVLNYLGAPAEDCEFLLERMCKWLDSDDFRRPDNPELAFTLAMVKAVLAHLYIGWIHPFGDGNGRTARLIEFQLLVQAGVPVPAAHLLSDHYNLTRERYYIELQRTSRPPFPLEHFIAYALQGFVDGIREQLQVIRAHQLQVIWENFVHDQFHEAHTQARQRQKHLVLDLPQDGRPVPRSKIADLSPRLVRAYHDRDERTLSRDLNVLSKMGLIRRVQGGFVANREIISAFLPLVADPQ